MQLLDHLPEQHVDELCELYEAEWWTRGRRRPEVESMLTGSTEIVAAIGDVDGEQRLIGFARALSDGAFRAIVFDMIVAATHRGRGVGRQVLEELLGRPSLARCAGVELMCLPEMAAYYERFGFRPGDPGVIRMQRPRS